MLEEGRTATPSRLAQFQEPGAKVDAMDLGSGFWTGSDGRLRALYNIYPTLGAATGRAGFGGSNLLNLMIFQGAMWKGWQSMLTLLEVLAMVTLAGLGNVPPPADPARFGAGAGLRGVLHDAGDAGAGFGDGVSERGHGYGCEGRDDQGRDAYITGTRVRINGTVDGDLIVFCQSLGR